MGWPDNPSIREHTMQINSGESLLGINNLYHGKIGYDNFRLMIYPCMLLVE
jgi:hypothetical protein